MNVIARFFVGIILFFACVFGLELNNFSQAEARISLPANGVYSLQPRCAPRFELAVQNASRNAGANVIIWSINSDRPESTNQRWRITRIGDSDYYKITAENSGLSLDAQGEDIKSGTNIDVWPYGYDGDQQFMFWYENGYYTIQLNLSGNYVLDVANGDAYSGNNVLVWKSHGGTNQQWKLVRLGN